MRLKAIWLLCALALAGLGLVTAGCGGGSTETVTVTETETVTVEGDAMTGTDTTETETETDAMETETDAMETTGTETTDSGLSSFATSENCQEFIRFADALGDALSGTGDEDVQEAADAMQAFADEAPEEIRDDFQVLADAYSAIAEAVGDTDLSSGETPPAEVLAALAQVMQEVDQTALATAGANISAWTTENCTGG
jgi:hypothetical protein